MTVKPGWARKRPTAATPLPEERSPWQLDSSEQRTLFVTFVGGLGSIVVGAALLGIALAFGRLVKSHPAYIWLVLSPVFLAVVISLFSLIVTDFTLMKGRPPRMLRLVMVSIIITAVFGALALFLLVLAAIGIAAGIK